LRELNQQITQIEKIFICVICEIFDKNLGLQDFVGFGVKRDA